MKHSLFLSSIMLLFFLIAKSSANPKTVTEEIIKRVCHRKTTKSDLCRTILTNHMGQPLSKPLARVSAMARDQAKSTGNQIWGLYKGIKDNKSELKLRLHDSWQKYTTAANLLTEANGFLQNGVIRSAKNRASMALSTGISGNGELAGHKQYLAPSVASGSRRFLELCAVLIALCAEL